MGTRVRRLHEPLFRDARARLERDRRDRARSSRPRVAVAFYCDDTIAGAFPCEMGDATVATEDFLSALDRFCEPDGAPSGGKDSLRVGSAPNSTS